MMAHPIQILPAKQHAVESTELLPAMRAQLRACLVGANYGELEDASMRVVAAEHFGDRETDAPAVALVQLPPRAVLRRGPHFIVETVRGLVAEQVPPPNVLPNRDELGEYQLNLTKAIYVEEPCLLVSRFGFTVWGHWMGEIFPRVFLAERRFPGKFKYVVPHYIFNATAPRNAVNSILDCFRSIGVERSRLLPAQQNNDYVFDRLYAVTPTYYGTAFHPKLIEAYRNYYIQVPSDHQSRQGRRIALLRTESPKRNITNLDDIVPILSRADFEFVEVGRLPYLEQIHLFSQAEVVVGVMASGLTGLLFAPQGVKVLTFSPKGYLNAFFPAILQLVGGKLYDLRGEITKLYQDDVRFDERSFIFSDFRIDPKALIGGLTALGVDIA